MDKKPIVPGAVGERMMAFQCFKFDSEPVLYEARDAIISAMIQLQKVVNEKQKRIDIGCYIATIDKLIEAYNKFEQGFYLQKLKDQNKL